MDSAGEGTQAAASIPPSLAAAWLEGILKWLFPWEPPQTWQSHIPPPPTRSSISAAFAQAGDLPLPHAMAKKSPMFMSSHNLMCHLGGDRAETPHLVPHGETEAQTGDTQEESQRFLWYLCTQLPNCLALREVLEQPRTK